MNEFSNVDIRVNILERLHQNPEEVMRNMCIWLGIEFDPILLNPTVSGSQILPNSSYSEKHYGINKNSIEVRQNFNKETIAYIKQNFLPYYLNACKSMNLEIFND